MSDVVVVATSDVCLASVPKLLFSSSRTSLQAARFTAQRSTDFLDRYEPHATHAYNCCCTSWGVAGAVVVLVEVVPAVPVIVVVVGIATAGEQQEQW